MVPEEGVISVWTKMSMKIPWKSANITNYALLPGQLLKNYQYIIARQGSFPLSVYGYYFLKYLFLIPNDLYYLI